VTFVPPLSHRKKGPPKVDIRRPYLLTRPSHCLGVENDINERPIETRIFRSTTCLMFSMSPSKTNKTALFIDGPNFYATAKTLGFDIDYKRLLSEFQNRGTLLRAFYYTTIIEDQEFSSVRPMLDWLDYNGYTVITKASKEFIDASGRRKPKGNMRIELAVDAMQLAEHIDRMVLFSGDGDFRSLVEAVQRRGVHTTVASTVVSDPPMIADELRRQADLFIDLVELRSRIGRAPIQGPPREVDAGLFPEGNRF
jgi:uncharacterized LabA/DUF88 family protein